MKLKCRFLNQITRLVKDPPPSHLFELSEAGVAFAHAGNNGFQPFEPGTLLVSPVEDNLLRAEAIAAMIERLAPSERLEEAPSRGRDPAGLCGARDCARLRLVPVGTAEEQLSLVRFRVKKTVPFDIDSAAVSYFIQPSSGGKSGRKKVEVLAVTVALEVIARYEALFRAAGFQPGRGNDINSGSSEPLSRRRGSGSGETFRASPDRRGGFRKFDQLFRCVTMEEASAEEILGVLHPTFAYVEDELSTPVGKLILCGFSQTLRWICAARVEPLRSRFGTPGTFQCRAARLSGVGRELSDAHTD